jgi:hypothetical protein
MKTAAMTFHVRALRTCGGRRIRARKYRMRYRIYRSRGWRRASRYAVREDDAKRRIKFSRLSEEIIDRILWRLQGPLLRSEPEKDIIFPGEAGRTAVLEPNRHTVRLLRDYEKKISTMVTDKDPALALRLENVCFLGIQFGQASVRNSFNEVVRRGSSGGHRTPETVAKQKSAHDRFVIFLRNEFDGYKKRLKKADREKPFTTLVSGFRESIPALITALEAQDDPDNHAFAKRLRGTAGTDGDEVMSQRQLERHLSKDSNTK